VIDRELQFEGGRDAGTGLVIVVENRLRFLLEGEVPLKFVLAVILLPDDESVSDVHPIV